MTNSKVILHLCADVGSDSKPYRDNNYKVILVGSKIGVENYQVQQEIYGIIANPVCTDFSIAMGFHVRRDLKKATDMVYHCLRIIDEVGRDKLQFYVVENPASGRLKEVLGKPDYKYEPWQYGDPWTKETALWGKFNIPPPIYQKFSDVPHNPKLYTRPSRKKPSMAFLHKSAINNIEAFHCFRNKIKTDADFRSLAPQGFARAFKEANP